MQCYLQKNKKNLQKRIDLRLCKWYDTYVDERRVVKLNALLLELKMKEANVTMEKAAKVMNIDPATFYRKKIGESDFYRKEIQILRKILNLSSEDVDSIFFNE